MRYGLWVRGGGLVIITGTGSSNDPSVAMSLNFVFMEYFGPDQNICTKCWLDRKCFPETMWWWKSTFSKIQGGGRCFSVLSLHVSRTL